MFGSCSFGCSRVETCDGCVTSPGKLSSAIVEFVAPLRLWHSLRPINGWFSRRESSGPARVVGRSRENGKRSFDEFHSSRESRERRERARHSRVVLNSPFFWTSPKAAGPIRALVRGGAPPARLLLQGIFHAVRNTFYPCIKTLIRFTHYNITFVILLIHIILQPFLKV